jgi:hypothetical protein
VARRQPYQDQARAYATVLDLGPLATLASSFASAKAQVDIAEAKLAASRAAFGRAQLLFRNQQNVSKAEMQNAEAAFRADQAAVAAASAQLRSLGATTAQDWGALLAREFAENGPLAARLIARQAFLVQVSLTSGRMPGQPPQAGVIELADGTRVPIRFVAPAPRVDPRIQGISFLYMVGADSGVLPGMAVLAFLPQGKTESGVLVPPSAIVWWQGRAWAYLRTGQDTFARQEIPTTLPAPDGSGGYIAQNLPAGAQIVTSGAQSLLSEEFRAQIDVQD